MSSCNYISAFETAISNYTSRATRFGYTPTLFTRIRHSFKKYDALVSFESELKQAQSDQQAVIIKKYLNSLGDNHHSFKNYLLDQLAIIDPAWESYYTKKIKFYTGILYRGTLQHPKTAFISGMTANESHNVEDYCNDTNLSVGVSTSKVKNVAKSYATSTFQTAKGAHYEYGYLYKINYRGIQKDDVRISGGVDIIETHKARGNTRTAAIAEHKHEVNIIGGISNTDIISCIEMKTGKEFSNPHYNPNISVSAFTFESICSALKKLFEMNHAPTLTIACKS